MGFQFQQFFVADDRCAMKVGTDGILLGAWAKIELAQHILDIGTGCGLLALMAAQRNPAAQIQSVESDTEAAQQAAGNFRQSPWPGRLQVWNMAIQEFAPQDSKFDSILCNPPFFTNGLLAADDSRRKARHSVELSLEELFAAVKRMLADQGSFSMIWPATSAAAAMQAADTAGLKLSRRTNVCPLPGLPPKRVLLEFGFQSVDLVDERLTIELSKHVYTDACRQLTGEFYLSKTV
ncbi:MAG: methyltransferase [Pirellulaceae bacterium]